MIRNARSIVKEYWSRIIFGIVATFIIGIRMSFPLRSLDDVGFEVIFDSLYAVLLLIIILLLAYGVGYRILTFFDKIQLGAIERLTMVIPLGLGSIGIVTFLLGVCGFISMTSIILLLVFLSIAVNTIRKRI